MPPSLESLLVAVGAVCAGCTIVSAASGGCVCVVVVAVGSMVVSMVSPVAIAV